ncbi:MAG: hypothetical protein ACI9MS_003154 [Glaciecola sp.]|jgi:hypothetical protein
MLAESTGCVKNVARIVVFICKVMASKSQLLNHFRD